MVSYEETGKSIVKAEEVDGSSPPYSPSLSADLGRRKTVKPYRQVSNELREVIIRRVIIAKERLSRVARDLNVNYTTASSIVHIYKKQGRVEKIPQKYRKKAMKIMEKAQKKKDVSIKEEEMEECTKSSENEGSKPITRIEPGLCQIGSPMDSAKHVFMNQTHDLMKNNKEFSLGPICLEPSPLGGQVPLRPWNHSYGYNFLQNGGYGIGNVGLSQTRALNMLPLLSNMQAMNQMRLGNQPFVQFSDSFNTISPYLQLAHGLKTPISYPF